MIVYVTDGTDELLRNFYGVRRFIKDNELTDAKTYLYVFTTYDGSCTVGRLCVSGETDMAQVKKADALTKIVAVLEELDAPDRTRVINAALTLFGEETTTDERIDNTRKDDRIHRTRSAPADEQGYFDAKDPRTKGEELAVAARYREEHESATTSTREELEKVIRAARRNFDSGNFKRDLDNARRKGLFNSGTGKQIVLSHRGQRYADALPDRQAAKAAPKPKRAGGRRAKKKTSATARKQS